MNAEVIVVDNASTDGSLAYLKPNFPDVQFIESGANSGFAKACNVGLQKALGEFILFLNPDTIVAEDSLQVCIDFLLSNNKCGAVGVKMIDGSGKFLKESKRSFPSPWISFFKLTGLATLFPTSALFGRYHLGHLTNDKDHEVDVLAGAFMVIRKEVLEKVGSFDEAFFMYGEDIDLSYRIQKAGYKNYYLAQTTIIHFKGESTKKGSLKYVRLFYKAMSIFVQKHYSGGKAVFFRITIQLGIWLRALIAAAAKWIHGIIKVFSAKEKQTASASQVLVVSSEDELKEVEAFIQSGLPFYIVGQTHSLKEINSKLKASNANKLIYVAGSISYKSIIADIMFHPGIEKHFHAYKSRSIICSEDSNTNGEAYPLS